MVEKQRSEGTVGKDQEMQVSAWGGLNKEREAWKKEGGG